MAIVLVDEVQGVRCRTLYSWTMTDGADSWLNLLMSTCESSDRVFKKAVTDKQYPIRTTSSDQRGGRQEGDQDHW